LQFDFQIFLSYSSDWRAFSCVQGSQPTSLIINLTSGREPREHLVNFLKTSPKLEVLDADDTTFNNLFSQPIDFPMKLKKIRSFTNQHFTSEGAKRFEEFLKSQSASLDEFEWRRLAPSLTRVVLTELKNLTYLNLDTLPTEKSFYEGLQPMESVKKFHGSRVPNELLGLFPNLEVLKSSNGSAVIPFLAAFNLKIKSLSLSTFVDKVDEAAKLPNLEYLYIEFNINVENLTIFLLNNLSIVTFCSRYFQESNQLLDVLLNMPKLRHIKLGGEVLALGLAFDRIKSDPKSLQTLEMIFEKVPGRPDVLFKLPVDLEKWDEKCTFLKRYKKDPESEFGYRISVCHTSEFEY
jgi:hypothetical protein